MENVQKHKYIFKIDLRNRDMCVLSDLKFYIYWAATIASCQLGRLEARLVPIAEMFRE
jgi:hypothetical protein